MKLWLPLVCFPSQIFVADEAMITVFHTLSLCTNLHLATFTAFHSHLDSLFNRCPILLPYIIGAEEITVE